MRLSLYRQGVGEKWRQRIGIESANGGMAAMMIVAANRFTACYVYDVLGRKTGMLDPDMGVWKYEYDNAGNLITQTDALSQSVIFAYDALNRVTGKWYSNMLGSSPASARAVRQYTTPTSSVLYFLHSDHLVSVSVTTCGNASGCGSMEADQVLDAPPSTMPARAIPAKTMVL
jgi:YD repeat-containing protein